MAMALHSYAQQQYTPHELLDVAAEHLVYGLPAYSPQAVATVMWAFGKLQVHPGRGLPGGGPCTPVSHLRPSFPPPSVLGWGWG